MSRKGLILLSLFIVGFVGGCYVWFRAVYDHDKRLRVVEPGRYYRSGQMTADGFRDAIRRYKIRTVINVQDEYPDPDVQFGFFSTGTIKESEMCRRLGVDYVWLAPDLQPRSTPGGPRPA